MPARAVWDTSLIAPLQLLGGLGVIHHNMPPQMQAAMVRAVKKYVQRWCTRR